MRLPQSPFVSKDAPSALNPYDILKVLALVLMIVDHIGFYFIKDENTYRLIGRLCVPIWLFLIGYARSRTIDRVLIGSALGISLLQAFWYQQFFTLNILWTIILLRLTLDPLMRWIGSSENRLMGVTFVFAMIALPTRILLDYGSFAWVLAMWGYLVRHGFTKEKSSPDRAFLTLYGLLVLGLYVCIETLQFDFAAWQIPVLGLGCLALYPALALYLPRQIPAGQHLPAGLRYGISAIAHHTLAIYVLHLVLIFGILFTMRFAH